LRKKIEKITTLFILLQFPVVQKKLHPFYFLNNSVKPHSVLAILAHRYLNEFSTK